MIPFSRRESLKYCSHSCSYLAVLFSLALFLFIFCHLSLYFRHIFPLICEEKFSNKLFYIDKIEKVAYVGGDRECRKTGRKTNGFSTRFARPKCSFLSSKLRLQLNRDLYWRFEKKQVEHTTGTRRKMDLWPHRLVSQY